MSNVIMKGKDTVSAKLAECFVTIEGNRYNFMQAINLEATMEKTKTEVPIFGKNRKRQQGIRLERYRQCYIPLQHIYIQGASLQIQRYRRGYLF